MSIATLTRADAPTDANWRLSGHCLDVDPDVMHPDPRDRHGNGQARSICNGCPVQTQCLADAVRARDYGGVRGGLTGAERRERYGQPKPKPCGTCQQKFTPRTRTQVNCGPCAKTLNRHRSPR
ncbi:WhiB family transcriptional regulator [Micromonospora purpureochromogenes]|uniref:WhiB family transcriptional regulator n=1 Tax=Micromonospora purpureochromogenes TaxID=47872 RepID=UPI0033E6FF85